MDTSLSKYLGDSTVQLSLDFSGQKLLRSTIESFYKTNGARSAHILREEIDPEWGWYYLYFLVDQKHVVRYGYGNDRGVTGGIELAIENRYLAPAEFWTPKDAERFTLEASTDGVEKNLRLLDEFLNYPAKLA